VVKGWPEGILKENFSFVTSLFLGLVQNVVKIIATARNNIMAIRDCAAPVPSFILFNLLFMAGFSHLNYPPRGNVMRKNLYKHIDVYIAPRDDTHDFF